MEYTDGELKAIWPELQLIAAPARERRRLDPAIFKDLILALCNRAPLSVRDLSLLLERSEAYVGDAIRPLVSSGHIQFLYPDQPKHPRQKYLAQSTTQPAQPVEQIVSNATSSDATSADAVREILREQNELAARKRSLERDAMAAQREAMSSGHDAIEAIPFGRKPQPSEGDPEKGWGSPRVSVAAAILIGIILAFANVANWPYYAAAAAALFAFIHVRSGSRQYLLYLTQTSMRPSGPRSYDSAVFIFAKAAFSFAEIAIVVLIVSFIRGTIS